MDQFSYAVEFDVREFEKKTGLKEVPDWSLERVKYFHELEDWYFYLILEPKEYKGDVSLQDVIGSIYSSSMYNGLRWCEMILNLKRDKISTVEEALAYIDKTSNSSEIATYNKFGQYYFITNGHHRTSFAKFSERETIPGSIIEYVFDFELYKAFMELSKHFKIDLHETENPSQPYRVTPFWTLTSLPVEIKISDRDKILDFHRLFISLQLGVWEKFNLKWKEKRFRNTVMEITWPINNVYQYKASEFRLRLLLLKFKN